MRLYVTRILISSPIRLVPTNQSLLHCIQPSLMRRPQTYTITSRRRSDRWFILFVGAQSFLLFVMMRPLDQRTSS